MRFLRWLENDFAIFVEIRRNFVAIHSYLIRNNNFLSKSLIILKIFYLITKLKHILLIKTSFIIIIFLK